MVECVVAVSTVSIVTQTLEPLKRREEKLVAAGHLGLNQRIATMTRKFSWKWNAQLVVVLLCAVGLKAYYSMASVNQLRWILAPTTWLVELVTGSRFAFESYTGYINNEHTFVIAASCAGVNFVIACFLMLAIRKLCRDPQTGIHWWLIPAAAVTAYLTTIIANTVRIAIALQRRAVSGETRGLSPEQVHRLEGVLVYFGFLLLLFLFTERVQESSQGSVGVGNAHRWLRSTLFPLTIYYATTLGMPFLNGAYRSSEFWEHSRFVLLAPIVLILPMVATRVLAERLRHASGSPKGCKKLAGGRSVAETTGRRSKSDSHPGGIQDVKIIRKHLTHLRVL
jgi:exosortase K